jgi:hypothetical protein
MCVMPVQSCRPLRAGAALALALLSAAAVPESRALDLDEMITTGGRVSGPELRERVAAAQAYPLGSRRNPVRAAGPGGQHAYLARLRCPDGPRPAYRRVGSFGSGPYESIIDGYAVLCPGMPEGLLYMDMYHPEHVESEAPPGFRLER